MTAIEHIIYRHSADPDSFSQGTTGRMIKGYVDEAPVLQNDGSYMLHYNLGRTIGTGSNGAAASDIMIYRRDGWIKTAFPIHYRADDNNW
jgi:hypothetical protein